jgi:hypothetical protein
MGIEEKQLDKVKYATWAILMQH